MKANLDIAGTYTFQGRRLTNPEKPFVLIVDHRKRSMSGKPSTFVLAKTVTGTTFETGKTDQYVSSVYPVTGQPFHRIEYQGIQYRFDVTTTGVSILPWQSTTTLKSMYNK